MTKVTAAQWKHTAESHSCLVDTHCRMSQLLSGHKLQKVIATQWTHTAGSHSCLVDTNCRTSQPLSGHKLLKVTAAQWTHTAESHSWLVNTHCRKSQLFSGHTLQKVTAAQWTHTAESHRCSVDTHCRKSQLLSVFGCRPLQWHGSGRQPKTHVKPEAAITVFELLMMDSGSPETCQAIKKHWNNKFYYTAASCWFFL